MDGTRRIYIDAAESDKGERNDDDERGLQRDRDGERMRVGSRDDDSNGQCKPDDYVGRESVSMFRNDCELALHHDDGNAGSVQHHV